MTAQEMFEKLGYEITLCDNTNIWFSTQISENKNHYDIVFDDIGNEKEITFRTNFRSVFTITLDELQAINKQCKELGWLDEKEKY